MKVENRFPEMYMVYVKKDPHIHYLKLYGPLQALCVRVWYFCLNIWFLFIVTFSQMAAVLLTFCNPMMYIEQIFV
jgi:hypothetical protein